LNLQLMSNEYTGNFITVEPKSIVTDDSIYLILLYHAFQPFSFSAYGR
jgi:hypothetical protein